MNRTECILRSVLYQNLLRQPLLLGYTGDGPSAAKEGDCVVVSSVDSEVQPETE